MTDAVVQRFELLHFDAKERRATPEGGIAVKARISRTGILEYKNPDGSTRRELRLPEDVFDQAALDSFKNATLTRLHPGGLVTPLTWRDVTIGNLTGDVAKDGEFASSEVLVRHAPAVRDVESGELKELSCGYQCKIDPKPGEHPQYGKYDCRQYEIRGNHVGVGPAGWGRSGAGVSLRFDAFDGGVCASELEGGSYVPGMTEPKDTKQTPPAPAAPVTKDDAAELRGQNVALQKEVDRLTAAAKAREDAEHSDEEQERIDAAVEARSTLVAAAKPHLDAKGKEWSPRGKTDDQIRREVLAKLEPEVLEEPEAKADGAESFIKGAFGIAVRRAVKATTAVARTLRASPNGGRANTDRPRHDEREGARSETEERVAGTGDLIADAADASLEKKKNAWQKSKKDRRNGGKR